MTIPDAGITTDEQAEGAPLFPRSEKQREWDEVVQGAKPAEAPSAPSPLTDALTQLEAGLEQILERQKEGDRAKAELADHARDRMLDSALEALDSDDPSAAASAAEALRQSAGPDDPRFAEFLHEYNLADPEGAGQYVRGLGAQDAVAEITDLLAGMQRQQQAQEQQQAEMWDATQATIERLAGWARLPEASEVMGQAIEHGIRDPETPEEAARFTEAALRSAAELNRARQVAEFRTGLWAQVRPSIADGYHTSRDEPDWTPAAAEVLLNLEAVNLPSKSQAEMLAEFRQGVTASNRRRAAFLAELTRNESQRKR